MYVFGIKLLGINAENGHKLIATLIWIGLTLLVGWGLRAVANVVLGGDRMKRVRFWTRQGINLLVAILLLLGIASIWFDDPARATTAFGLFSAGLAFALQRVITSLAGYFVILRGNNFTVGDRIAMGGVRGDVIALGFIQTTIMEMGQPPGEQADDPSMWVKSRQFTGRIVTVSNSEIFDKPIYNYTREFPFIFEEMTVPIPYRDDRAAAEKILLTAAQKHTIDIKSIGTAMVDRLGQKYGVRTDDFTPRVYWRLTDNWVELSVRFLVGDHGVRERKDAMARDVLAALDAAGIGIASSTSEVTIFRPKATVK